MTRSGARAAGTTFVAFLRGINVGRARQVAMADLRDIATSLGYDDVRTLLRSGNLVFTFAGGTTKSSAKMVGSELEHAIETRLGMSVGVVVRSAEELAAVVAVDPLPRTADGSRRHVIFLAEALEPDVREWLRSEDFTPDTVHPAQREVYVWYERGMSGSTTADRLGKRLPRSATDRNWNTVTKLLELARPSDLGPWSLVGR